MNYLIGKIGKATKFDSNKWLPSGGDAELPSIALAYIHAHPEHTFYLASPSDYGRIKPHLRDEINKHGNVINIWNDLAQWRKANQDRIEALRKNDAAQSVTQWYIEDWVKDHRDLKIDRAIILAGPCSISNIFGHSYRVDHVTLAKPICAVSIYAGGLIYIMNEYADTLKPNNIAFIATDRRYAPSLAQDWFNVPKHFLAQWGGTFSGKCRKGAYNAEREEREFIAHPCRIETSFLSHQATAKLIEDSKPSQSGMDVLFGEEPDEEIRFSMAINDNHPSRIKMLQKYILNGDLDGVEIYGDWKGKDSNGKPYYDRPVFKGPLPVFDFFTKMHQTKYTFLVSIDNGYPTPKFWECIMCKCVPFVQREYLDNGNFTVPEILIIDKPEQLKERMDMFDANPDAYEKLWIYLNKMIEPYMDGSFIVDTIDTHLTKLENDQYEN